LLPFRLANYKNGGELIDAYNLGGQAEVEKLIQEQFGVLMYADGKGQVINRAEYLRWKFRGQEQVLLLLSFVEAYFFVALFVFMCSFILKMRLNNYLGFSYV
jgi:hypothetical protein